MEMRGSLQVWVFCSLLIGMTLGSEEGERPIMEELTDATFEKTVFPADESNPKPYFILFYAPWCGHCKRIKPIFYNASDIIQHGWLNDGQSVEHLAAGANFAMVDGTTQVALSKKLRVNSYPTFFYSFGTSLYRYNGFRGLGDFLFFAKYLHVAWKRQFSFADDFAIDEVKSYIYKEIHTRVSFTFALLPDKDSKKEISLMKKVMESSVSTGIARFNYVIEQSGGLKPSTKTTPEHQMFNQIVTAVANCRAQNTELDTHTSCLGPNGEVLVVYSDAHESPLVYYGKWRRDPTQVRGPAEVHPQILKWISDNAVPAAPGLSGENFGLLSQNAIMGVAAVKTSKKKLSENFVWSLRKVIQQYNGISTVVEQALRGEEILEVSDYSSELRNYVYDFVPRPVKDGGKQKEDVAPKKVQPKKKRLVFGELDGEIFEEYLNQLGFSVSQLPLFFMVEPGAEVFYFQNETHQKLTEKNGVWSSAIQKQMTEFIDGVAKGTITARKYTTMGKIAVILRNWIPGVGFLQNYLEIGDMETVALVCTVLLGLLTLIVASRGSNSDDESSSTSNRRSEKKLLDPSDSK